MWKKRLSDQSLIYFRFAPPFTELDTYTDSERIEPPYPNAPSEHCSIYYLWWAYLKENTDYIKYCECKIGDVFKKIYTDFGDIRDNDFFSWWKKTGRDLFRERELDPIRRIHSVSEWSQADGSMIIRVPPTRDLKRLTAEFEKFLKNEMEGRPREEMGEGPHYPISGNPNIQALYKQLFLYQLKGRNPDWSHEKLSAYMDMVELGLTPNENDFAPKLNNPESVRQAIRSDISRKLKRAKTLITNVGKGHFPDYGTFP